MAWISRLAAPTFAAADPSLPDVEFTAKWHPGYQDAAAVEVE
jgi:hypothetical protein